MNGVCNNFARADAFSSGRAREPHSSVSCGLWRRAPAVYIGPPFEHATIEPHRHSAARGRHIRPATSKARAAALPSELFSGRRPLDWRGAVGQFHTYSRPLERAPHWSPPLLSTAPQPLLIRQSPRAAQSKP